MMLRGVIVAGFAAAGLMATAGSALAADGMLDPSFDGDGKKIIGSPAGRAIDAVVVGNRTYILHSGPTSSQDFEISALNGNGTFDDDFAGSGLFTVSSSVTQIPVGGTIAFDADSAGRLVVIGSTTTAGVYVIARITPDGAFDPTFGGDGILERNFGDGADAGSEPDPYKVTDVAIGPGDKPVIAAQRVGSSGRASAFAAARLDSDGDPDTTFSGDGVAAVSADPTSDGILDENGANAVDVQPDGKVVLAGFADVEAGIFTCCPLNNNKEDERIEYSFAVVRLTATGFADSAFAGGSGISYPNVVNATVVCESPLGTGATCHDEFEEARDVVVADDGKIVVGGFTDGDADAEQTDMNFAVARLNANGSTDSGFSGDGRAHTSIATAGDKDDRANSIAVQADGKVLLAGEAEQSGGADDFAVARFSGDGTLDTAFDGDSGSANGKFRIRIRAGSISERAQAIALRTNQNAVVAGSSSATLSDAGIAQIRTDGVAPNTSIIAGPAEGSTTADNTPTFTFNSNEASATFQCHLENEPLFLLCANPFTTPPLTNAAHAVTVRAIDAAGNADATPLVRNFTVNASPPDTDLTADPGAFTADTTPSFSFVASPSAGATFSCAIDADPASSCTSPHTTATLADGAHTFTVTAGNGGGDDPTPEVFAFQVDTAAPEGVIVSAPLSIGNDPLPVFDLTSDEPADNPLLDFDCVLSGTAAANVGCAAGQFSFAGPLAEGAYTMTLHVSDPLGRNDDDDPASVSFEIDLTAPDTLITGGPPDKTRKRRVKFTFEGVGAPGGNLECSLDGKPFTACTSPVVTRLKPGKHRFQARATDLAGNADATPAKRTVRILRKRR